MLGASGFLFHTPRHVSLGIVNLPGNERMSSIFPSSVYIFESILCPGHRSISRDHYHSSTTWKAE
jgi:hypothetical protein